MNYDHWRHYARGWLLHFFGRTDGAHAAFIEALRAAPQDIQSLRHLAAIAAARQRWESAESWFGKVVELMPDDADVWFNLGFARERAGQSDAAITAFAEAVRLKPSQDRAWYGMGLAHARVGRHAAAAAALREAVKLQPMNGEAYYQLGMALHHADLPDEFRQIAVKLIGFEPQRARQLVLDAQRTDLLPLIPELPF